MNFSYSTCRPKSPSIICLDFNLRHAYTHTHARSLCETHKKCCIPNRRSAKRAQGAFDKPKQHNAQRVVSCLDMLTALFMPRPRPSNWALRLIYVPALSLSLFLAVICLVTSVAKYQQLPLFLSRPHASNDINFRLTALQRVYLFYNNKQRGVGAGYNNPKYQRRAASVSWKAATFALENVSSRRMPFVCLQCICVWECVISVCVLCVCVTVKVINTLLVRRCTLNVTLMPSFVTDSKVEAPQHPSSPPTTCLRFSSRFMSCCSQA